MSLMNQRLRRMGRHIPPAPIRTPASILTPTLYIEGCARGLSTCDRCVPSCDLYREPPPDTSWVEFAPISQSLMATHDDPLLMDTTLDSKPRKGGRHRRQR